MRYYLFVNDSFVFSWSTLEQTKEQACIRLLRELEWVKSDEFTWRSFTDGKKVEIVDQLELEESELDSLGESLETGC